MNISIPALTPTQRVSFVKQVFKIMDDSFVALAAGLKSTDLDLDLDPHELFFQDQMLKLVDAGTSSKETRDSMVACLEEAASDGQIGTELATGKGGVGDAAWNAEGSRKKQSQESNQRQGRRSAKEDQAKTKMGGGQSSKSSQDEDDFFRGFGGCSRIFAMPWEKEVIGDPTTPLAA